MGSAGASSTSVAGLASGTGWAQRAAVYGRAELLANTAVDMEHGLEIENVGRRGPLSTAVTWPLADGPSVCFEFWQNWANSGKIPSPHKLNPAFPVAERRQPARVGRSFSLEFSSFPSRHRCRAGCTSPRHAAGCVVDCIVNSELPRFCFLRYVSQVRHPLRNFLT